MPFKESHVERLLARVDRLAVLTICATDWEGQVGFTKLTAREGNPDQFCPIAVCGLRCPAVAVKYTHVLCTPTAKDIPLMAQQPSELP